MSLDGAALETVAFQQLKAINEYQNLGYRFYYWRTKTKLEVDFVLYGERGLKAFEIKWSPHRFSGRAFHDAYGINVEPIRPDNPFMADIV